MKMDEVLMSKGLESNFYFILNNIGSAQGLLLDLCSENYSQICAQRITLRLCSYQSVGDNVHYWDQTWVVCIQEKQPNITLALKSKFIGNRSLVK